VKVLVCGSRDFYDWRTLEQELYEFRKENNITQIIQGCAHGTDRLAKQYGLYENIPVVDFPARWDLYGKRAGPIRNGEMLREGRPDLVFAFRAQNSIGTSNMIAQAEKSGVKTIVVNV
jgi:hypothetical protein